MRASLILLTILPCLLAGGCCSVRQQQLAALESENSQLNGMLWELQFAVEELEDENASLKRRLSDGPEDPGYQPPVRAPQLDQPAPSGSDAPSFDPDDLTPPEIELPEGLTPGVSNRRPAAPAGASPIRNVSATLPASREEAVPEPNLEVVPPNEVSPDSDMIQQIVLGPMIGTLELDGRQGDDGLVVVVEPWDATERMLAAAGDITVVLIDPAAPAATARYARWEFEAAEAAKLFRAGDIPGLHLELPWPDVPPEHDQLHLFVRFTTTDGRSLEADTAVEVERGGRGRWVASPEPHEPRPDEPLQLEAQPEVPFLVPPALAAIAPISQPADESATEPSPSHPAPTETADATDAPDLLPVQAADVPRIRMPQPAAHSEPVPEAKPEPSPEPKPEPAPQRPQWSPSREW